MLDKLIIANNQFGECEEIPVMEKICEVMTKNDNYFIFKHTYFYEKAFSFFLKIINQNFASVERFLNIRLFLRSCIS